MNSFHYEPNTIQKLGIQFFLIIKVKQKRKTQDSTDKQLVSKATTRSYSAWLLW